MNLPQWFLDDPAYVAGDEFYLRAFWDLSTERDMGMGLGPIPWSSIVAYGERAGLDDVDLVDAFVRIIREMDVGWLKWQEAQAKKKGKE